MIDEYDFGRIVIDGRRYTSDVIIYPDRVYCPWWRKEGHRLSPEDIEDILDARPEVVVVGTGNPGLMNVPPETEEILRSREIELVTQATKNACQTFNRLSASKRVVAALHLTC